MIDLSDLLHFGQISFERSTSDVSPTRHGMPISGNSCVLGRRWRLRTCLKKRFHILL